MYRWVERDFDGKKVVRYGLLLCFCCWFLTSLWAVVVVSFDCGCCGCYGGSGCFFVVVSFTFSYHLGWPSLGHRMRLFVSLAVAFFILRSLQLECLNVAGAGCKSMCNATRAPESKKALQFALGFGQDDAPHGSGCSRWTRGFFAFNAFGSSSAEGSKVACMVRATAQHHGMGNGNSAVWCQANICCGCGRDQQGR